MAASERAWRARLALILTSALLSTCSRKAEIYDEPDGLTVTNVMRDESPVESTIATVADPPLPACTERPRADGCIGVNDFPCNFDPWARGIVLRCQDQTDCRTNGRVIVEMGDDGCVADVFMSEPNEAFVSCVFADFGRYSCKCTHQSLEIQLGYGNQGCAGATRTCSVEFPCPEGQSCLGGYCVTEQ